MSTNKNAIVMYESDEAASIQTLTGWVDRHGRYWGDNEHQARWCGATHRKCAENPEHPIHSVNSWCDVCHAEKRENTFNNMPRKPWKDEPLVIHDDDRYFFDIDDLRDYCMDNNILPEELRVVICEPNYASEIDGADIFCDDLPPDGDLPSELQEAFDALNAVIKKTGPLSWSAGKYAAELPSYVLDDGERNEILVARGSFSEVEHS